jgi:hydroxymethylglutaryl-CoA lyase
MSNSDPIQLVECPRDAMQGWKHFIPTETKIAYLQELLNVGFHTLDFGSFVSAKAIPQMADTHEVIQHLQLPPTTGDRQPTKLLAIIANRRGAEEATKYNSINCLGFPFSVSPTFQQRNTNSTIAESLVRVAEIQELCESHGKELVIYISMAFGNPYGDPYNEDVVFDWISKISALNITTISLADTVGLANPEQVYRMTSYVIKQLPGHTVGVHLHSTAQNWKEKIDAALAAGCIRFDGALKGIGGCPMANDELVGNMNSEWMIPYFKSISRQGPLNEEALERAVNLAAEIFV